MAADVISPDAVSKMVAETTEAVSASPPDGDGSAKAPVIPEAFSCSVPKLKLGGLDDRGNTVKYIYSIDPTYIIYYSRMELTDGEPDSGSYSGGSGGWRWLAHIRSWLREPAYEREGVQALLSSDPTTRQVQVRKLLPLGTDRAKLRALLSGWPRRESYDSSIATALQLALDGNGDGKSAENALAALADAKASIANEREIAGRGQYVSFAFLLGILGFVVLSIGQHNLFPATGDFWQGTRAGLLGAIFSIAIGMSNRTVAPDTNIRGNLTDSLLRLVIGAISGGTIVLLSSTGLVPALHTYVGNLGGGESPVFVLLLGIIAGFVERLVPGLLDSEGRKLGGGDAVETAQVKSETKTVVASAG